MHCNFNINFHETNAKHHKNEINTFRLKIFIYTYKFSNGHYIINYIAILSNTMK